MKHREVGKIVCIKIVESLYKDAPRLELELNKVYEAITFDGMTNSYYYIMRPTGSLRDIFPIECFITLAELRNQRIEEILYE